MSVTINGTTGVSLVQDGAITSANLPAGSVLQMAQTVKTDTFSTTAVATWTAVTGLSVSITPQSSSNKVLVSYNINLSNNNTVYYATIYRNGSILSGAIGNAAGSRPRVTTGSNYGSYPTIDIGNYSFQYLDSPATTSSITYQIYVFGAVAGTTYLNQSNRDSDTTGYDPRSASSITVMEIAA